MKLVQCSGVFLVAALLGGCGANGSSFGAPLSAAPGVTALTKESAIHIFQGSPDGGGPFAGLVAGKNEEFYGTTFAGGNTPSGGLGTVFEISSAGKEKVLYSFQGGNDGLAPQAGLIVNSIGNLYGDTAYGGGSATCTDGCGAVFEVSKKGAGYKERVLYAFQGGKDGQSPIGTLLADKSGSLYGTTNNGGIGTKCTPGSGSTGCGTVYKLTRSGSSYTEKVLYAFTGGKDGAFPKTALIADDKGQLYGTTYMGGTGQACTGGCGVVFKLSPKGTRYTETVLHDFQGGTNDGDYPRAALLGVAGGDLIGATTRGAGSGPGGGTVYELVRAGTHYTERLLYVFTDAYTQGAVPDDEDGLYMDAAGHLYGTTIAGGSAGSGCGSGPCGTVFMLTPSKSGSYSGTVLHSFQGGNDGAVPRASLAADPKGTLYSTTESGGTGPSGGYGLVFKVAP